MAAAATKRLRAEERAIQRSGGEADIALWPTDPSDMKLWTGFIRGPTDTPYTGGVFELAIKVGPQYPVVPPAIAFVTKVFHPNVLFRTGEICLDLLKAEWSPAWGLQSACRAIVALLADPQADSPLNCDAGNMIRAGDTLAFHSMAAMYTLEEAARTPWPTPPQHA